MRADTLVVAAVPPAASSAHPSRDVAVTLLAIVVLALALFGAWRNRDVAVTRFENRTTATWPEAPRSWEEARTWSRRFETAFADRFGGRDRLVRLHHWILAVGLHVSPVAKVLLGNDGWLFFRGEDEHAIDRDFRGIVPYPPEQPAAIAAELARRQHFLAERGIPYFVLIVPDKATVYAEHLPPWVRRAPQTRLDRLFQALAQHPEVQVIDPRAALEAAKAHAQVYFRTDSHWNYEGAIVAYDLLMTAVQRALPAAPHVPAERPPYEPGDEYSGDLADMLGLPEWFREDDRLPLGKILGDPSRRCARPIVDPIEPVVMGCARAGLPRAVVYRDSMMDALIPPLSENFRRVVYFAGHRMTRADIEREHPDVVIEEFVERTMHALLVDPVR